VKTKWWQCSFGSAAVAVALGVGALAPANAAIVVPGRFDPLYGTPFSGGADGMYWSGTAEFFFSDGCGITSSTTTTLNIGGSCTAYVQNATVDLKSGTDQITAVKFAELVFGTTAAINSAKFVNGQLVGVSSDAFDPWVAPTNSDNTFFVNNYVFTLGFDDLDHLGAMLFHDLATNDQDRHKKVHHFNGKGIGHFIDECKVSLKPQDDGLECGRSNEFATMEYATIQYSVPEPGVLGLMLAGFMGVAFGRRRSRSARN
jgi:hypothetical protein